MTHPDAAAVERKLLAAARRLLDACTMEFGWCPGESDDAPVTDDPECAIRWSHLRELHAAVVEAEARELGKEKAEWPT